MAFSVPRRAVLCVFICALLVLVVQLAKEVTGSNVSAAGEASGDALRQAKEAIERNVQAAKEAPGDAFQQAKGAIERNVQAAKEAPGDALQQAKEAIERNVQAAKEVPGDALQQAKGTTENVREASGNSYQQAKSASTHIFDSIKDKISLESEDVANLLRLSARKETESQKNRSFTTKIFAILFPSSKPALNALLATAYISGPPNFLLALCPPSIDPSSLSIMVAFAVGGLLGDTFFHLLPEIFLGEDESATKVRIVALEPNRNLLLGVAIFIGLATFMGMDKGLRIATGGHSHSHDTDLDTQADRIDQTDYRLQDNLQALAKHESHDEHKKRLFDKPYNDTNVGGKKTRDIISDLAAHNEGIRRRATGSIEEDPSNATEDSFSERSSPTSITQAKPSGNSYNKHTPKDMNPSVKLAGLLNLLADFTHNITDGLALSTSFYASPALGATTTMAVFFHEIPHEVGDFALLIQSGFSKRRAMAAQFVTAIGAFLGTIIGILVQEYGSGENSNLVGGMKKGLLGTSLQWADLLLPFTAGTFLYVGTVGVIPELLENEQGSTKTGELKRTGLQFGAMAVGASIMIAISWS